MGRAGGVFKPAVGQWVNASPALYHTVSHCTLPASVLPLLLTQQTANLLASRPSFGIHIMISTSNNPQPTPPSTMLTPSNPSFCLCATMLTAPTRTSNGRPWSWSTPPFFPSLSLYAVRDSCRSLLFPSTILIVVWLLYLPCTPFQRRLLVETSP